MKIDKVILGITGEYYVAAELGKRNIYAQLTLGNLKRADLLIFSAKSEKILKIEVKCKQGKEWPNCKGIYHQNTFMVFVNFQDIAENQRPDFYILSVEDWSEIVKSKEQCYLEKHPARKTKIERNVLVLLDETNSQGKPYEGCSIKPKDIEQFKEKWEKLNLS